MSKIDPHTLVYKPSENLMLSTLYISLQKDWFYYLPTQNIFRVGG